MAGLLQWILARIKQQNAETLRLEKREIVGAFHWYEKGYIWLPKKNLSKKARELAMVGTERKWEKVEVLNVLSAHGKIFSVCRLPSFLSRLLNKSL